jgi:hypothetical protein
MLSALAQHQPEALESTLTTLLGGSLKVRPLAGMPCTVPVAPIDSHPSDFEVQVVSMIITWTTAEGETSTANDTQDTCGALNVMGNALTGVERE